MNRTGRYQGFSDALEEAGLPVPAATVPDDGDSLESLGDVEAAALGRNLVHRLAQDAEHFPTAICTINDMTALGVCRGLRDVGLRVGHDVSVAGFDDIVLADLCDPPLTTIRQPINDMARIAVDVLTSSDPKSASRSVLMRPELVVRESTAKPPRTRPTPSA